MSDLMRPGSLTGPLARATMLGKVRSDASLTSTALLIERRAKEKLNEQQHAPGTRTKATPGGPPAKISGQLLRSVTHVTSHAPEGLVIRIGPADTPRTPYGQRVGTARRVSHRRVGVRGASNGAVGKYLETGLRNGARYPWLLPAFKEGLAGAVPVYRSEFSKGWKV